jgi:hypothetical protein
MRHPSGEKGIGLDPHFKTTGHDIFSFMADRRYIWYRLSPSLFLTEKTTVIEINAKTIVTKEGKRGMATPVPIWFSVLCSSGNRCYGESLMLFSIVATT